MHTSFHDRYWTKWFIWV